MQLQHKPMRSVQWLACDLKLAFPASWWKLIPTSFCNVLAKHIPDLHDFYTGSTCIAQSNLLLLYGAYALGLVIDPLVIGYKPGTQHSHIA